MATSASRAIFAVAELLVVISDRILKFYLSKFATNLNFFDFPKVDSAAIRFRCGGNRPINGC